MKSNQLGQLGAATATITASSVEGLSRSGERVTGIDERLTVNGFALQNRTNLLVFDWIIKFLGGKAVGDCGESCEATVNRSGSSWLIATESLVNHRFAIG